MITIERTVTIPADRRLRLDVALPDTFKPGSALRLEIRAAEADGEAGPAARPKTKESMLAAVDRLCGLYAGVEPPGAYLERHHAENLL
ncbi:MAG: hypothetical protein LBB47_04175, partial [Spirochaetaceae bacterium]|nr:hypothetical protein [Spirochaetaceae bacterium]